MKFWMATLVCVLIGAVFGYGLFLLSAKDNPWLFIVAVVGLIGAISYFCATDPSSTPDHH